MDLQCKAAQKGKEGKRGGAAAVAVVDEMIPYALAGSVPAFALFPKKKPKKSLGVGTFFPLSIDRAGVDSSSQRGAPGWGLVVAVAGHGRPAAAFLVV